MDTCVDFYGGRNLFCSIWLTFMLAFVFDRKERLLYRTLKPNAMKTSTEKICSCCLRHVLINEPSLIARLTGEGNDVQHLCAVTYMTEISLIVTLNNKFNSTQLNRCKIIQMHFPLHTFTVFPCHHCRSLVHVNNKMYQQHREHLHLYV